MTIQEIKTITQFTPWGIAAERWSQAGGCGGDIGACREEIESEFGDSEISRLALVHTINMDIEDYNGDAATGCC